MYIHTVISQILIGSRFPPLVNLQKSALPSLQADITSHLWYASICQDVSLISVLLIVGVHVVVEEGPTISSAQWTLGRSPKRLRNRAGAVKPWPFFTPSWPPPPLVFEHGRGCMFIHHQKHLVVASFWHVSSREGLIRAVSEGSIQDVGYRFPRTPLLGDWVNRDALGR